jgi:hypothetical protein
MGMKPRKDPTPRQLAALAEHFAPEPLDKALEPWIGDSILGAALKHPLVFMVPYTPHHNKMANKALRYKREAIARALTSRQFGTVIFLHEKPYRIEALFDLACEHRMSAEEFWPLLGEVWTNVENLWQCQAFVIKASIEMLLGDVPNLKQLEVEIDDDGKPRVKFRIETVVEGNVEF